MAGYSTYSSRQRANTRDALFIQYVRPRCLVFQSGARCASRCINDLCQNQSVHFQAWRAAQQSSGFCPRPHCLKARKPEAGPGCNNPNSKQLLTPYNGPSCSLWPFCISRGGRSLSDHGSPTPSSVVRRASEQQ
jgi:hypothetical protein